MSLNIYLRHVYFFCSGEAYNFDANLSHFTYCAFVSTVTQS